MNKREEEKLKKQQERLEKEIARTKAMSTFEGMCDFTGR